MKVLDIKRLFETAFVRRERPHPQSQPRVASAKGERVEPLDTEVLVTFDVADQEYALGLDAVREIVPAPDGVTTVPRAEAVVVGMMPYRGQLLPLLSLRGLLGFSNAAERTGRERSWSPVWGSLVGLMADRARTIVSAERRLIDPLPSLLAARTGGEHPLASADLDGCSRRVFRIRPTCQGSLSKARQSIRGTHQLRKLASLVSAGDRAGISHGRVSETVAAILEMAGEALLEWVAGHPHDEVVPVPQG